MRLLQDHLAALLAAGLIIIVYFAIAMPVAARTSEDVRLRILTWTGGALLFALWLPHILNDHSGLVLGTRYFWLGDDAMISMRFARNAARGLGWVWNPGERVEGYTNFLWTAYMTLVHWLPVATSKISLVVLLTNLGLAVLLLALMARLAQALGGGIIAVGFTVAAAFLNMSLKSWTLEGFESTLLAVVVVYAALRILREARDAAPRLPTFLVIALIPLIRADGAVLAGLLYLFALGMHADRKRVIRYSAISLLLPVAHLLFRIAYYGELLPNTALLKVSNWDSRVSFGVQYTLGFLRAYILPLALAAFAVYRLRGRAFAGLGLIVIVYIGYVTYIGGDAAFENFRFFVPIIPLVLVLAFRGAELVTARAKPAIAIALVCLLATPNFLPRYATDFNPSFYGYGNATIGVLLGQSPAGSRVADFWAGSTFYFSDRYGIDLLGKSDPVIAAMPAAADHGLPGHNKYDFAYSLGRLRPDYVVAGFALPVDSAGAAAAEQGDLPFVGALYFDPTFRQHCFPNPILPGTIRTVFHCRW